MALAQVHEPMNRTLEVYLGTEPLAVDSYLLEQGEILNPLIAHAVAKEVAP
ncbi:hypothetical protein IAE35_18125 [Pseudomonas sp. S75]|uniref:hypothetical protein n=1 Tax=unclassified Pseudomonas TaxID=196821 RepID=UPI001906C438|nr:MULTISPECIES: hypothetical protein [unclassified Pseudomonas]MBJ9977599.1 hypothetical protein [Pseudomonas sp. S30]MBK0155263.1 hypothetical protein [Pseudomonas sp. S75]